MNAIAEAKNKKVILRVYQDQCDESPREWENLGKMICWHNRYTLGDKHDFSTPEDFDEWRKDNKALVLPLYLYDHSGISMSTNRSYPFNCLWDSGQVGWIYCTYEDIRKEYSVKHVTKTILDKASKVLECEVRTFDQFLTGDIFGFVLSKVQKCGKCDHVSEDTIESVWGFYGSNWKENGMVDHVDKKYQHLFAELA